MAFFTAARRTDYILQGVVENMEILTGSFYNAHYNNYNAL